MSISLVNQKASQALRGEDVVVTLASGDLSNLANIPVGTEAYISGTSVYGSVARVDTYGTSLEVSPVAPNNVTCLNFINVDVYCDHKK
mgnify:CR=1 FL=1